MVHESEKLAREIPAWAKAKEYGIDIAMLYDNIKLTPTERIRRHQIAVNTFEKIYKSAFRNRNEHISG